MSIDKTEMYVVYVGHIRDGFTFYGPFSSSMEARYFGNTEIVGSEWGVVPVAHPTNLSKPA